LLSADKYFYLNQVCTMLYWVPWSTQHEQIFQVFP
jgi:hypothetical protein